jgi:cytochrome c-type biogenesis protein CcmH
MSFGLRHFVVLLRLPLYVYFLLSSAFAFSAAIESHQFSNEVERMRYQGFIEEMRCPKCQNQNLAGSDSPISVDLRRELYVMIKEGKSDKEVVDYMVSRYGEFILYRPRVSSSTYVLWSLPVLLLVIGVVVLIAMVRRRRSVSLASSTPLSAEEQERLNALLMTKAISNTQVKNSTENRS